MNTSLLNQKKSLLPAPGAAWRGDRAGHGAGWGESLRHRYRRR
ncbi:MAG: hypothetical protein R2873_03755 [Caldilineaceae bacterium]